VVIGHQITLLKEPLKGAFRERKRRGEGRKRGEKRGKRGSAGLSGAQRGKYRGRVRILPGLGISSSV